MCQNPRAFAATAAALAVLGGCATGSPGTPGSTAGDRTASPATDNSATGTPAQQKALARYLAYAGAPIPYFAWVGRLFSWEPLSKDQLVVQVTPGNDYYLLKVWPPCDLRLVINGVGISSLSKTVYARGDSVTLNTGSGGLKRCPIDQIRRIDYQRMRADLQAQSAAAKVAQ
jgi:Family of unknown function (DUF6491)